MKIQQNYLPRGITLIELLVATVLMALVMAAFIGVFDSSQTVLGNQENSSREINNHYKFISRITNRYNQENKVLTDISYTKGVSKWMNWGLSVLESKNLGLIGISGIDADTSDATDEVHVLKLYTESGVRGIKYKDSQSGDYVFNQSQLLEDGPAPPDEDDPLDEGYNPSSASIVLDASYTDDEILFGYGKTSDNATPRNFKFFTLRGEEILASELVANPELVNDIYFLEYTLPNLEGVSDKQVRIAFPRNFKFSL